VSVRWAVAPADSPSSGTRRAGRDLAAALEARGHSVGQGASPPDAWLALDAAGAAHAREVMRREGRGVLVRRVGVGETVTPAPRRWFGRARPAAWVFASRADAERAVLPAGDVRGGVVEPWALAAPTRAPAHPPHLVLVGDAGAAALHEALRGAASLLHAHPLVRLILVGGGVTDDAARVHAGALGIAGRVVAGQQSDDAAWYASAVAAWIVAEGDDAAFGALTAAAHGVPVVLARGSAAARVLPAGLVAELVPVDEPLVAAAAMARWLGDPARRAADGDAARQRVGPPATDPVDTLEAAVANLRGQRPGARASRGAA
jgi:hypothetical protein